MWARTTRYSHCQTAHHLLHTAKPPITYCTLLTALCSLQDGKLLRASMFRYILTANFMIFHSISAGFRREYPDPFLSLLDLGLLNKREVEEIRQRLDSFGSFSELTWVPLGWAQMTATKAFKEGQWHCQGHGQSTDLVMEAIRSFRATCGGTLFQVHLMRHCITYSIAQCKSATTLSRDYTVVLPLITCSTAQCKSATALCT